jgi:putative hydrolase of the HAD superfamily
VGCDLQPNGRGKEGRETVNKPQMIIFDYGQTLVAEEPFDGIKGTAAVMQYAVENKYNLTPEQIQQEADTINQELKRFDPATRAKNTVEIPNHMFTGYLYEYLGIKIDLSAEEIDRIFWDAASPGKPTEGLPEFLEYLYDNQIRAAVLSNITYAGSVVSERINRLLPDNHFEFILATSEYLFRKPHNRIFDLALKKAGLKPKDVWYIGDNYACDVVGARNAGLFPVWYKGAVDFEQPDFKGVLTITNWNELKNYINTP